MTEQADKVVQFPSGSSETASDKTDVRSIELARIKADFEKVNRQAQRDEKINFWFALGGAWRDLLSSRVLAALGGMLIGGTAVGIAGYGSNASSAGVEEKIAETPPDRVVEGEGDDDKVERSPQEQLENEPSGNGAGAPQVEEAPLRSHVIVRGEGLCMVARSYGTTLNSLLELNPSLAKDPDRIAIGKRLKIPPYTPLLDAPKDPRCN